MQEIDFGKVAVELGIRKEDGLILAQRLHDFIKAQAEGWSYHEMRMYSALSQVGRSEFYGIEAKRWEKYLGMTAPKDLPNLGLGQTFLVAWSYDGGSRSGGKPDPMKIWLAEGLKVIPGVGELIVNGYLVGNLVHGETQIELEKASQFHDHSIYIDSSVIIASTVG